MGRSVTEEEYRALAGFRQELRAFLSFSEDAAQDAGLTPQQHQAMLAIRAAPGETMLIGALAQHLALRPHSVTGLVDRLERQGLVARQAAEDDRRRVAVSLSEKGGALIETLSEAHRAELRRLRPLLANILTRI